MDCLTKTRDVTFARAHTKHDTSTTNKQAPACLRPNVLATDTTHGSRREAEVPGYEHGVCLGENFDLGITPPPDRIKHINQSTNFSHHHTARPRRMTRIAYKGK